MREHRVDDDGMALDENARRALDEDFVDLPGHLRPVGAFRQPIGFLDLEKLLPQHVCPQHDGAGLRRDGRGERARQHGLSGSGQSADSDQRRGGGVDRPLR